MEQYIPYSLLRDLLSRNLGTYYTHIYMYTYTIYIYNCPANKASSIIHRNHIVIRAIYYPDLFIIQFIITD